MLCPRCSNETQVIDSRDSSECVRRRRECTVCKQRFTTYERAEPPHLSVRKRSNDIETFDADKLRRSIKLCCKNRPISSAKIDELVTKITYMLYDLGKDEVSSSDIGKAVQTVLLEYDQIAYLRFTSVYQAFSQLGEFERVIETIEKPS